MDETGQEGYMEDRAFSVSWSATMDVVGKLSYLARVLGVTKSEVIRQAIMEKYDKTIESHVEIRED